MLREDFKEVGFLANVARELNKIGRIINGLSVHGGRVSKSADGRSLVIHLEPGEDSDPYSEDAETYGFKVMAAPVPVEDRDNEDVPEYIVTVINGTAQVFGGMPWAPAGNGQKYIFPNKIVEGSWIVIRYSAFDISTLVETGIWSINAYATMEAYDGSAPSTLFFPIAQIGADFNSCVNQLHKGAIVMPAISNVVDLQGQVKQVSP